VNQALHFLQQAMPPAKAAQELACAHSISVRQAHRYIQLAQQSHGPVHVPEEREVFTVKLPRSLIIRVRQAARHRGGEISTWVAAALQHALPSESEHG
jgi:hypothetical protein